MIAVEVARNPTGFDCGTCQHRNCDLDGEKPGSNGPAGFDRWEIPGVIRSDICLLPMVTGFSRECLTLHRHYKNGVLIQSGGLYDQPNAYIQAMSILDAKTNQ